MGSRLPIMQTTAYRVAIDQKPFEKACIEIDPTRWNRPTRSSTR
jgi:NitT/TauT family transport system substrate-binding protein